MPVYFTAGLCVCVSGLMKVRRFAAGRASVSVVSVCVCRPVSAVCTGRTVSVMTSLACASEESCAEVSTLFYTVRRKESADSGRDIRSAVTLWNVNERITHR